MSIRQFQNRHAGEDIYVLGAGNTLSYLDPAFFAGKVTVGVNYVPLQWTPTTYAVSKYHGIAEELAIAFPNMPVFVPRHEYGNRNAPQIGVERPNLHVFEHGMNPGPEFDAEKHWPEDPDELVVSWSTITTAMHLAAYMGAATVIMVAADCGQLGERLYVEGYEPGLDPRPFEVQSLGVKRQLVERYGCRVYSLSPFYNYALEGTPFRGTVEINVPALVTA